MKNEIKHMISARHQGQGGEVRQVELWRPGMFFQRRSVQVAGNKLRHCPGASLPPHQPKGAVLWAAKKKKRMELMCAALQNWNIFVVLLIET